MSGLPGAEEAAARLRETALRNFGPPLPFEDRKGKTYKLPLAARETPVPRLIRYALSLVGLEASGPGEKVAWWVDCTFRGEPCEVAHQKFGVRIYVRTEAGEAEAQKTLRQIHKQITSAMRTVEKVVLAAAPAILGRGNATVVNQHRQLRRAYEYFRERAESPAIIEDERTELDPVPPFILGGTSFKSGQMQMDMNAFHDLVAAITAYLSLLEHDLVLALAFADFDPDGDDLTKMIGSRWGEKWARVLGTRGVEASRFRDRLGSVIERWRNPYSHGGFEKGHGATIYLQAPGVGAVPVGMTSVTNSPHFSFIPANETDIAEVFALFDELDLWLKSTLYYAFEWIESDLAVRFDEGFRAQIRLAIESPEAFNDFLEYHGYLHDQAVNMDF